ncbi:MAG: hypothetical protein UW81_C0007G0015 [Candidatus Giovannonibacteria bacterium GW2011_GWC2_44_9]|uniref:Uncharacterized protein n=2 Tax=Candidatus Giovannoniibacteriota TaxID=1752738 RepID=A0A0G1IVT3_9BACT|nr:MAG: hypothetical protein UW57_C0006G0023 [Candidatus Giovannonibacteria bacterium GW2011_GWA1_44_29]KKT84020.1 MAG: hypothetical protein UW81_C0007G0015 [Candidatus Giovannonibacteria bacterium GW2011_GWC2_44_9]KKT91284.1 MAG: hypothetical protein UW93_C0009G0015 [Parcubacteria group bacterium GW2011_GWC1_45_13]KKU29807.1 MAG: hypothetical protein UX43_C0005G0015 [Candidatus Giovannonibacteria bacterium GW2011_GWB1_46_20]
MIKKYFVWGVIIFVAWIYVGVGYQWIHKIRVNRAFVEFQQILLESKNFRARYRAELKQLLNARATTPSEKEGVKKRLFELKEEIKKATERLVKAQKKFCDLVGEEDETFCQENQNPAPLQGWPIRSTASDDTGVPQGGALFLCFVRLPGRRWCGRV